MYQLPSPSPDSYQFDLLSSPLLNPLAYLYSRQQDQLSLHDHAFNLELLHKNQSSDATTLQTNFDCAYQQTGTFQKGFISRIKESAQMKKQELSIREKGLKNLSGEVLDIFRKYGALNFNQASDLLLLRFGVDRDSIKAVKSFRRRVYDAINILIALDFLEQNKKLVLFKKQSKKEATNLHLQELRERVSQKQEHVSLLRDSFNSLLLKFKSANNLQQRNKLHHSALQKVQLPFVLVRCPSQNRLQTKGKSLLIQSQEQYKLMGDADCLMCLGLWEQQIKTS